MLEKWNKEKKKDEKKRIYGVSKVGDDVVKKKMRKRMEKDW